MLKNTTYTELLAPMTYDLTDNKFCECLFLKMQIWTNCVFNTNFEEAQCSSIKDFQNELCMLDAAIYYLKMLY